MKSFEYTITSPSGLDAVPAGKLCKEAAKYQPVIKLYRGEKAGNAKSILSIMSLGIKCGETIKITVDGDSEAVAAFALEKFCKANL